MVCICSVQIVLRAEAATFLRCRQIFGSPQPWLGVYSLFLLSKYLKYLPSCGKSNQNLKTDQMGQRQTGNCSVFFFFFFHLTWNSNTVALCLYGIVVWHSSLFQDSYLLQFYIRLYHRYMFLFCSSNWKIIKIALKMESSLTQTSW